MTDTEFIAELERRLQANPKGVLLNLADRTRLYKATDLVRMKPNGGPYYFVRGSALEHRLARWRKKIVLEVTKELTRG